MAVGLPAAWAQTPEAKTTTVGNNPTLRYNIPSFSATGTPAAVRYQFNTVPATGIVRFRTNADGTGVFVDAAANTIITTAQAGTLGYVPANQNNNTGTFSFTYGASSSSNGGGNFSGAATYTINVVIRADDQTAVIMPNTNAQTAIPALTVSSTLTPAKYRILTFPTASQGLLYVNGTQVTAARDLTPNEATQLTFDPAPGFAGNAIFTFAAADNSNNLGTTGRYSLPVSNAACGVTAGLDFSRLPNGQDWKAQTATVGNTTVTTTGYATTVAAGNTNTFAIGDNGTLPGPALVWQLNNIGNDPTVKPNVSTVTYTFSRPVSNLSLAVSDIDRDLTNANFIDEMVFDGFATTTATTPIILSAGDVALASNGTNQFGPGANTIVGSGTNAADPAGTVVISFPSPVQKLVLTYRNTAPYVNATTNRTQTVGFPSFIFCSQADAFTRFASGTNVTTTGSNVNYSVDFGNNGPDNIAAQNRTVTLPAGATNVVVPTGATYTATTRVIDFGAVAVAAGATTTATFSFNAPATAGTYSIVANTSSSDEDTNAANNTATQTLVVGNCAVTSTLNYTAATTPTGNRKGTVNGGAASEGPVADVASDGITVKYVNFTAVPAGVYTQNDFLVGTSGATSGQTLVWQVTTNATGSQTSVTLLLSKPVDNFSFNIQDIDRNTDNQNFIDRVKFDGFPTATGGTAATLTASNFTVGTSNAFIGDNTIEGTNNSGPGDAFGNLTVRFTSPVQRVVLTYSNQSPSTASSRLQTIGINMLTYCSPADVFTVITPATNPVNGGSQGQFNVSFGNDGPNAATAVVRQVQLPANLMNVVVSQGGTYNAATGLVTYPTIASLAGNSSLATSVITFTTPISGTVAGTSSISTTASEGGAFANNTSSTIINITPVADVATVITGPVNVNAAQTASLNVTFSNEGAATANTVTRRVTLPAGVSNVNAPGGTVTGTVLTGFTIDYPPLTTLAPGASASFAITYTAPPAGSVTATSTTSTTSSEGGLTANNTSSVTTTVGLVADVTTTVSGPTSLNAGQPSGTYTAAFTNNGPSTASAVTQRVTLPAGVTNVMVNGAPVTPVGGVIDFGTAATLASGATNLFTFSFTAPITASTVVVASAVGTATNQGNNTAADNASLSVLVNGTANVAATITAGVASVAAGQPATFNVDFSNSGPQTAAGVVASVQLPANLTNVVASNGGTYNSTTGVVTYAALTTLANGANTASVITFTAPVNGPVTGTASISTTTNEAGQTANNTANATINITPTYDVTTRISGPVTTAVGVQTTFSVSTINNGPSVAPSVVQTVTGLPTNLTNVYVSNGGTYNAAAGTVTFPALATLANGGQVDNTISFTPTAVNAAGFVATATATANTNNANDSNTANNTASAPSLVVNAAPSAGTSANLFTTITTPLASVVPGATITFNVVSGNDGPDAASQVAQFVTLPAGLTNVVVKNQAGTVLPGAYNATTGVVTFPVVTSLLSSARVAYTIEATAPASTLVAAVATISSATADPMPSNNIATADVTIIPTTDVVVRLTGPNTAGAGTSATYVVTTTNNGPVTATGVVTAVSIPTGLTGVTVSGGGTYNPTTGAVTFPTAASLLNGASVSNTITYSQPGIDTYSNVASVTSTTTDNVLANNTSAVRTVIKPITDLVVSLNGPASTVQGNQVDYVVSAINNGPSTAANTVIRVQLPAGLGTVISSGTYNNTTGVLTFPAILRQPEGSNGAVSYGIQFVAPTTLNSLYATASVSTDSEETNYANNTATVTTTAAPATAGRTDLAIVLTPSSTTPIAGQPLTLTVVTTNLNNANTTTAATNVVQRVAIEPGLTVTSITNGGTYNAVTGVITFPALSSLAIGASVTNSIVLTAPGAPVLTARALVTGDQTDVVQTNNVDLKTLSVAQRADVTTAVTGPVVAQPSEPVTYTVVTRNNGPSVATDVQQTVTLPLGATNVVVSGGGTVVNNTVTFPVIASQPAGTNGQVVNTISFTAPATFGASYDVTANVTTTSTQPTVQASDVATLTTFKGNRVPVANAVVNALQTPQGNTAAPLAISPLSGSDQDGNADIASYTITSIPNSATQGLLSLNGNPVSVNQVIALGDIDKLTFDPLAAFVGNAFFTYTATDKAGAISAPALFTIPVGQDINSSFSAGPAKGGANQYQNGDLIAQALDTNGAQYDGAAKVVDNGVRSAQTDAAGSTILSNLGLVLNPITGAITVADRTKMRSGTYSINVTTVDRFGGTNTTPVSFTIGSFPLPVELAVFTATAVNADAQLKWTTASEKNNAYFDVERSLNGTDFAKIGQVKGQGNSSASTDYALTDAGIGAKTTGLVYYRLKQVDVDGTASFSPVRTLAFAKVVAVPAIALYPNPATATTQLDLTQLPTGTYQVSILDATGRVVLGTTLGAGSAHALNLNTIASGTYMVLVRGQNNGQTVNLTKRLVKE